MELRGLASRARSNKAAIYTFERGKSIRHPSSEIDDHVARAQGALQSWGVKPGMRVGIYAPNCFAWLVYDLALVELGAISVPFTDDFAGQIDDALLARYDIALLLISRRHARHFTPLPGHFAFIDADNGAVQALDRMPPPQPDAADQHSLVFSSGSAGGLKGLVISRKGVERTLPPIMEVLHFRPGDRLQLFLPMSNFQQRNMCYLALWYDFDLIITDYPQLFDAMQALNPTILIAPPVLYQMIQAEFERSASWQRLLQSALGALAALLPGAELRQALARRIYKHVYAQFGGNIRLLVTGMAPIRAQVGRFFERIQLPLCESYGMVEAGSITYRHANSREFGSVGKILSDVKITFQPDGEILVHREYPLTLRYFQCAEGENERTFVAPGTVASGDVGRLDANGNLFLMGRKKELIITAGGFKVHPEVIERELNNCPEVVHSVVLLKPGAAHLTCVVELAAGTDPEAPARVRKFATAMKSIKGAAQFVEVIFADAPFTKENGMLRPNLKIDRKAVAARYIG